MATFAPSFEYVPLPTKGFPTKPSLISGISTRLKKEHGPILLYGKVISKSGDRVFGNLRATHDESLSLFFRLMN